MRSQKREAINWKLNENGGDSQTEIHGINQEISLKSNSAPQPLSEEQYHITEFPFLFFVKRCDSFLFQLKENEYHYPSSTQNNSTRLPLPR